MTVRICAVVPTFNNPDTLRDVVVALRKHVTDVIVVDDGSGEPARSVCVGLADEGLALVHHRAQNGGKGAAVKDGLELAQKLGFTHALQIDADLQHEVDDIPRFLEAARQAKTALILGSPVFDDSAPASRLFWRKLTRFFVHVQTGGRVIRDPMCGFRVYPLSQTLAVRVSGNAMDFDPEVAVKLHWYGAPIENLPTRVRYRENGVSHFRMVKDNLLLTWMHIRLCFLAFIWNTRGRPRPALPPSCLPPKGGGLVGGTGNDGR
jgi:glycosyltransferase involved in cell wall biosynthesis